METQRINQNQNQGTADVRDTSGLRDYASEETLRAMLQPEETENPYNGIWAKQIIERVKEYSRQNTQAHPYHNFQHELDVAEVCARLAQELNLPARDRFVLNLAAPTHDLIVVFGAKDNEVKTARRVNDLLVSPEYRVSHNDAEEVGRTIVQTEVPQKPYTLLGEIICDADLASLGRVDFFEKGKLLALEWKMPLDKTFYERQLAFIKSHKYHTEAARKMFDEQKARNIAKLEEILAGT
jgi:predicted metal-dependent HD superfamily phosphohydrolase